MATSTVKTNKPLNPRGVDKRPVDKYNRGKIYSGKALDFDGVNDYVSAPNISTQSTNVWTYTSNVKFDDDLAYWFDARTSNTGHSVYLWSNRHLTLYDSVAGALDLDFTFEFGQWYNIALTSDGTNAKLYVNGVLADTISYTQSHTSTGNFIIGVRHSLDVYWYNGNISGFKAFNTALTAAQVADLYNNPEKIVPTGVADSALKLWLPMMEGAGTTAYNGAPDALGSELVTDGTFDDASNWDLTLGSPTISGGVANFTASGDFVIQSNVVPLSVKTYKLEYEVKTTNSGALRLDGGSSFVGTTSLKSTIGKHSFYLTSNGTQRNLQFKSAGFIGSIDNVSLKEISNTGTISGATWTHGIGAPVAQTAVIDWNKISDGTNDVLIPQGLTAGRDMLGDLFENVRKQGALNLDGNSWAEVHDNSSLDLGSGQFTLEAWVRVDKLGIYQVILEKGQAGIGSNRGFMLRVRNNNNIQITITGDNEKQITNTTMSQDTWTHLCVVKGASYFDLYINGAYVTQSTNPTGSIDTAEPLLIGKDKTNGWQVNGDLAQPRIYNRALTAAEVKQNYDATKDTYI